MEDDTRQKKVEAGKKQLNAYTGEHSSSSKYPKKRREMEANSDTFDSDEVTIRQNKLQSPRSTLSSMDSDNASDLNSVLSELQNVIAIKEEQFEATKNEVLGSGDGDFNNGNNQADSLQVEVYQTRIREYEEALKQRDGMIEQLTNSLQDVLAEKEKSGQVLQQMGSEMAVLRTQLHYTSQMVHSDSENSPTKQLLTCQRQLNEYETIVKEQISFIQRLTAEATEKDNEIERSKKELSSQKSQSAAEVQQLMSEVQKLNQETRTLLAEREDLEMQHNKDMEHQSAELEEQFGNQVSLLTDEWRQIQAQQQEQLDKQHTHEIELIRATHGEEIAKLRQALLDHGTSNNQVIKLQEEVQLLTSQLKEQQTSWSEDKISVNSELESLRAQLSQTEAEKHQLDELANEKDKSLIELNEKFTSLQSENESMQITFNLQIDQLKFLNNQYETAMLELKDKYEKLENENNILNEKIKSVDCERDNLNQELSKVRSIQSKCDLLQGQYMGVLSEKKDAENEIAHLYSQVKSLKKQVASKKHKEKTMEKEEDLACVEFENEVDAAEKGVFSPKRLKLDVPTSPASIILWIERCESLDKDLRTAQANVLRLQTQLQNEQLQNKLLTGEKATSANKLKELQEKMSSLQKTAGSLTRSKKLMNQYEMKIASLENEKTNLSKSLEQLGVELEKSQTNYEERLHNLQEQICSSLNVKSNNIEELILESCSKAKELVVLKETLRSHCENETMLQNKIELLDKLVSEHEESFKASQEELEHTQEQLTECWNTIIKREELICEREHEIAVLNLQREQLQRQAKVIYQSTQISGPQKELLSLVEELATETFELKLALSSEKYKNQSLSKEVSPFKTEQKLGYEELLLKLQEQQKIIEIMKSERTVGEWASKLEDQLGEMIQDLTALKSRQDSLSETQKASSALKQDFILQKQQLEQKLQAKCITDPQLQEEHNSLRSAKLQIKLLETQLADKDKEYQDLLEQQEILQQELLILETSLESKEMLLQDQRLRLETEVRHRELQIKQCQAEARCREVELLLPSPISSQIQPCADYYVMTESAEKLEEMRVALDAVHAAAVAKLKLHLNEDFALREAELSENFAVQQAEIQEKHVEQVCELNSKLVEKEKTQRSDSYLQILSQLGLPPNIDTAQARLHMQDKLKQDLALLRKGLSESESSVYGMLESKFQQLAQQQILLAMAKMKEESDASFAREISSLNLAYSETLKSLQDQQNVDLKKQLIQVKQELTQQYAACINNQEAAETNLQGILKQEKNQKNNEILHNIETNTRKQYTQFLQGLCNSWNERCKIEVQSILAQVTETWKSDNTETAEKLESLQQRLLLCARDLRSNLCDAHTVHVDKLVSQMQSKHAKLQQFVSEAQELQSLRKHVDLLIKERDSLLDQKSEVERLQKLVAEFEKSSAGVSDLLKLKEETHKKEMDELRTYFQQKCCDLEKEYTEKVLSQHSRNTSSSGSEHELNSSEMLCAEGDHANRLASIASLTHICDSYSDIPSFSDPGEQCKELERRLLLCKNEMDGIKQQLEAKYESDIQKIKSDHEQQIRDLVRDLRNGHHDEISDLTKSHEAEMSKLQSVHKGILSNLEMSHQSMLSQEIEHLRSDMSMSESHKLRGLREQLEEHVKEMNELKCSYAESHITEVTNIKVCMESPESPSREQLKLQLRKELKAEFNNILQAKLQEQSEIIASQVDEVAASIKSDAEKEQAIIAAAHQQTLAECVAQHQCHLEALKNKYDVSLAEIQAKLRELHQVELKTLEDRHQKLTEALKVQLQEDFAKEQKRKCDELLEQTLLSHKQELELAESRLNIGHNSEVDKLKHALEQQEASYVQLLEETRSLHGKELAQQADNYKQQLHDAVEQATHDLVKTLGEQMQAMLSDDIGCENWPPELKLLNERLSSKTHKELDEAKRQHENHIRLLREQHQKELATLKNANINQKIINNTVSWETERKMLRTLISELFKYMITLEEELNNFVDQNKISDVESVASSEVSQQQECECPGSARKVRFAPSLETVTDILSESSINEPGSTVIEDLRRELEHCLTRMRKDIAEFVGVPEKSLIPPYSTSELEQLRCKLVDNEKSNQELEVELQVVKEKLAEVEHKKKEVINEGYGEGIEQNPDLEKRLERLSDIQDRARSVLLSSDADNPPHLLALIEELSREGDLMAEEARKDKEDLTLQIEAADKQLKALRLFMEEQAAEREQERDEFSKELGQLQEMIKERERDRIECGRLTKEAEATSSPPCTSVVHQTEAESNIEALEIQVKENVHQFQEYENKIETLNTNLKASSDKISVLRETIQNLEANLEQKAGVESDLRKRLTLLQLAFDEESKNHSNLADELESLRGDTSNVDLTQQICVLEEQIHAYTQQLEYIKNHSPGVLEMKAQIQSMEASLDRRTRELERLHNASISTCSSPSEDVSIREQLEASRAAVRSQEGDTSSPLSLRRLQEKMQHHARAEEAAFKRIRDLEMQLNAARHSEEEIHAERDALQQRVEEQLLQISSLQASLDQQRLQQSAVEARDAAITRRQLQASAERLDQARDLLQAKDTEISELRTQLEKTKKVIVSQEEELSKKSRDTEEEIVKLGDQVEELQREKETLEISVEEARATPRRNSRLLDSLLAEKNAEIDELGLQVAVLRERLELISSRLTSDVTKDDIMDLMREVRTSHGELKNHCSTLHSTLHSNGRSEIEILREARPESVELPHQASNVSSLGNSLACEPIPEPVLTPAKEEVTMKAELPAPVLADVSILEEQVLVTKQQLANKEAEIRELKNKLKGCSEKLNEEINRLREENNQLKSELNAVSGRLEEYAHLMQSEMEHSASLDQSLLQASSILLGNDRDSLDSMENADLSLRSENLQRLLSRVQKGGFEVLSLSEVALLHKHTHSLLHSDKQTVATQTSRSGLSDAKQAADLQQQLSALEQSAAGRDKRMAAKVESLEAALSREKQISHECAQNLDREQQNMADVQALVQSQLAEIQKLKECNSELSALLVAEQRSTFEYRNTRAAQVAEMQKLREASEEIQIKVQQQEHNMQQARLDLEKERLRAASLESSLAAEELNTYKQRAHYEGECVRHQATMRRNAALTEMLDLKLNQAKQTESSLRQNLEQEQSLRRSLQEQVSTLHKCRNTDNLDMMNQELKSSLEQEQEHNIQLTMRLTEQQTMMRAELQACEARERKKAEIEINSERETALIVKHSLDQIEAQLQSTLTQVQTEREIKNQLTCRIQELEAQLLTVKEGLRNAEEGAAREKLVFESDRNTLELALKQLYAEKVNCDKECTKLRLELDSVTHKWEEGLTLQKYKTENQGEKGELYYLRMKVQELENSVIMYESQMNQLHAELRAVKSANTALLSQKINLEHQSQVARSILATERTNWLLEKNKLLSNCTFCSSPHAEHTEENVLVGKLQYLFGKCRKAESYRKALVWQKRYLLVVFRGVLAREEKLKQHILQINGPHNGHILMMSSKPLSPLQRFKAAVIVVASIHRMKFIVQARHRAYCMGSCAILKRLSETLIMSPEPRLDPPISPSNGESPINSYSPPTRDTLRDDSNNLSRSLLDSPTSRPRLDMNEYRLRSDLLQQRLGLDKKFGGSSSSKM